MTHACHRNAHKSERLCEGKIMYHSQRALMLSGLNKATKMTGKKNHKKKKEKHQNETKAGH